MTLAIALTIDAPALDRLAAALERLADCLPHDAPGLAPVRPLILVNRGARLDLSMAREIPQNMDGIETFTAQDYDGPVTATVTSGNGTVAPEGDAGNVFRISPAADAAVGDEIVVRYSADERHGSGQKLTEDDETYTVVAADAQPLTEEGFVVVDKGAPAPSA